VRVERETTIIIGGDICPVHRNEEYFCKGDAHGLFNDLLEEIQAADLTVMNLECPLIEQKSPITKRARCWTGPLSRSRAWCVVTFAAWDWRTIIF